MEKIKCKNCGEYTSVNDGNSFVQIENDKIHLEIDCEECEQVNWTYIDPNDLQADT